MSASRTDRSWRARRATASTETTTAGTPVTTTALADGHVVLAGGRLEDVLAEVERTFGAAVDIVRVDRSIVGGIAGFFGREHFEVELALSAVGSAAVPPAAPSAAPLVASAAAPADAPAVVEPASAPAVVSAPEVPVATEPAAAPAAPTATGGAAFAAALQEALEQLDEEAALAGEPTLLPAYAVVEDPPPELHAGPLDHAGDLDHAGRLDHAGNLDHAASPESPAATSAAAEQDEVAMAAPAPVESAQVETAQVAPAPVGIAPAAVPGIGSLLSLHASGMSLDELAAQVDELAPVAPDSPAHGVIAVAGDGDEALVVAEALSVAAGGDPGDVIVMSPVAMPGRPSWMCLNSPEQAAARRDVWRDSARLVVVAVVVTPGEQGQQWGRAALAALEPDQTRVAVPGWRRPDEVVGRLAAMSPVHAIDLVGAADPSAVVDFLDLAVPVATIDGEPATPTRWAEVLLAAGHLTEQPGSAPADVPVAEPVADEPLAAPPVAVPAARPTAGAPRAGTIADDPVLTALLVAAAQEQAR